MEAVHVAFKVMNEGEEPPPRYQYMDSSCKADSDLWYKPVTHLDDGFEYYAYILLYINDCLEFHHDTESILYELDKYF